MAGGDVERQVALRFVDTCRARLLGLGPLSLDSLDALRALGEEARDLADRLEESTHPANVVTRYIQNSHVEATGRIVIPQGACFYSHLFAREGVVMHAGVFRGDAITVQEGEVVLDEVGSPNGARVQVTILGAGRFRARLVHPNVRVTICGRTHLFEATRWRAEVRATHGGDLEVR